MPAGRWYTACDTCWLITDEMDEMDGMVEMVDEMDDILRVMRMDGWMDVCAGLLQFLDLSRIRFGE